MSFTDIFPVFGQVQNTVDGLKEDAGGSVLNDLWDNATKSIGSFTQVVADTWTASKLAKLNAQQEAYANEAVKDYAGQTAATQTPTEAAMSTQMIVGLGLVALAGALLLIRK